MGIGCTCIGFFVVGVPVCTKGAPVHRLIASLAPFTHLWGNLWITKGALAGHMWHTFGPLSWCTLCFPGGSPLVRVRFTFGAPKFAMVPMWTTDVPHLIRFFLRCTIGSRLVCRSFLRWAMSCALKFILWFSFWSPLAYSLITYGLPLARRWLTFGSPLVHLSTTPVVHFGITVVFPLDQF